MVGMSDPTRIPARPRDARRTVAASLQWIADTLLNAPDDPATLDRLVEATKCLHEAERVIEMWMRIIEERNPTALDPRSAAPEGDSTN